MLANEAASLNKHTGYSAYQGSPPGGGVLPEKLGGGVRHAS